MKKSISFLIIPTMLISSCTFTQRCTDLWNKIFHKNKQLDVITIDSIVDGLEKLETLTSFTATTNLVMNNTGYKSIESVSVPITSNIVMKYDCEQVGRNSKTVLSYDSTETAKISDVKKLLNLSNEETLDVLLRKKYSTLESEYSTGDVLINKDKDEVKFVSSYSQAATYQVYDEQAKQMYSYTEDDDDVRYDVNDSGMGIISAKDLIEVVKKGTVSGDNVIANIDGTEVAIKVSLKDGYVSKLEAAVDETTNLTIEYSKFNETSFEMPANIHKPTCIWQHDAKTPFSHVGSDEGHRKYCQSCHKFLEEKPIAHVHTHNSDHVCEICGYVDGTEDIDNKTVPGFENGEKDHFLQGKIKDNVICSYSPDYSYNKNLNEIDSEGNSYTYYIYINDNAVLVEKRDNKIKIDGICMYKQTHTFELYKNLSNEVLSSITNSGQLGILKEHLDSVGKSATFTGVKYDISHTYHSETPVVIDECHKYKASTCSECGVLIYASIETNHAETLVETETVIDACHKLVKKDCPVCHEHSEEIVTSHSGEPRLEAEVIDPCHKLIRGYCSTCNEYLGKMIQEDHTGSTKLVNVQVDSCTTKVLTVCTSCDCIVDKKIISNHEHLRNVVCGYDELDDYGLLEHLTNVNEYSTFEFAYCDDCHHVINSQVKEYDYSTSMDHPYSETSYKLYDFSNGYTNWNYEYEKFNHSLDEHGICVYCHSKVVEMGGETIGFIARYNTDYEYWDNYYFYNKETGSHIWISEFDYSPEEGTDEIGGYYEYTNDSYSGVAVRVYAGENGYDAIKVFYNNLSESVVIRKTDFAH